METKGEVLKAKLMEANLWEAARNRDTVELRKLCQQVGYDYWLGVEDQNAIDCIDSYNANNPIN
jgi:hypothetical protein